MKGYTYHGKDCSPCFFFKHRDEFTVENHCYNCIDNVDIALHKPNEETDFVHFTPISAGHLMALEYEQKRGKDRNKRSQIIGRTEHEDSDCERPKDGESLHVPLS